MNNECTSSGASGTMENLMSFAAGYVYITFAQDVIDHSCECMTHFTPPYKHTPAYYIANDPVRQMYLRSSAPECEIPELFLSVKM